MPRPLRGMQRRPEGEDSALPGSRELAFRKGAKYGRAVIVWRGQQRTGAGRRSLRQDRGQGVGRRRVPPAAPCAPEQGPERAWVRARRLRGGEGGVRGQRTGPGVPAAATTGEPRRAHGQLHPRVGGKNQREDKGPLGQNQDQTLRWEGARARRSRQGAAPAGAWRRRSSGRARKRSKHGPRGGPMLTRPEIKSCCQVEILDEEHVILVAERESHLLTGSAFRTLVHLLDGSRTTEELVKEAVAERVSAPEAYYCLDRMEALGCLRESQDALARPVAVFWDSIAADTASAGERLRQARVAIAGLAGVATGPLAAALAALAVAVAAEGEEADLSVVLVDDYLRPELAEINRARLGDGKPWLLARPLGSILWLGPLLHPGRTGCWECLAQRLRGHRAIESAIQAR